MAVTRSTNCHRQIKCKVAPGDTVYHFVPYCKHIAGRWLARFRGTYIYVSVCGDVIYNEKTNRFVQSKRNRLKFFDQDRYFAVLRHRVVLISWKGLHPNKSYTVDHLDHCFQNFHLDNLRWASKKTQSKNRRKWERTKRMYSLYEGASEDGKHVGDYTYLELKKMNVYPNSEKVKNGHRSNGYFIKLHPDSYKDLEGEKWKKAPGLSNVMVSNLGRVYVNSKFGCPFKYYGSTTLNGYKKIQQRAVSRLVYAAFVGPIPPGMDVDHIDSNRENNRVDNLQVLTRSDNLRKRKLPSGPERFAKRRRVVECET